MSRTRGRGGCGVRFSHSPVVLVADDGDVLWLGDVMTVENVEARRNVPPVWFRPSPVVDHFRYNGRRGTLTFDDGSTVEVVVAGTSLLPR